MQANNINMLPNKQNTHDLHGNNSEYLKFSQIQAHYSCVLIFWIPPVRTLPKFPC